ncbi:PREDICTED: dapper homolog 3-like [Chinchilla lanigera]|uniref:dapper homolog 3-like n=1 Tax=Chinchilla lanigera TaxID=34839 RepID=UPI0006961CB0|nr:PREDICTED: dapper homolog 3-like [Chinchilla lanigera]
MRHGARQGGAPGSAARGRGGGSRPAEPRTRRDRGTPGRAARRRGEAVRLPEPVGAERRNAASRQRGRRVVRRAKEQQLRRRSLLAPLPAHWTVRGFGRGTAPAGLRLRLSPLRLPPSLFLLLLLQRRRRSGSNSSSSALLSLLPSGRPPAPSRTKTQTLKSRRRRHFRRPAPAPPPRRGTQQATSLRHFRTALGRPLHPPPRPTPSLRVLGPAPSEPLFSGRGWRESRRRGGETPGGLLGGRAGAGLAVLSLAEGS